MKTISLNMLVIIDHFVKHRIEPASASIYDNNTTCRTCGGKVSTGKAWEALIDRTKKSDDPLRVSFFCDCCIPKMVNYIESLPPHKKK